MTNRERAEAAFSDAVQHYSSSVGYCDPQAFTVIEEATTPPRRARATPAQALAHIEDLLDWHDLPRSIFDMASERMNHTYTRERDVIFYDATHKPTADGEYLTCRAIQRALGVACSSTVSLACQREAARRARGEFWEQPANPIQPDEWLRRGMIACRTIPSAFERKIRASKPSKPGNNPEFSRKPRDIQARYTLWKWLSKNAGMTTTQIAKLTGAGCHTSVSRGIRNG